MANKEKLTIEWVRPDSPTRDFTDQLKALSACQEAVDWCDEHSKLSVDELLDKFQEDSRADQSWATWALIVMGEKIHPDIRRKFLAKLRDPGFAFHLYCRLPWLTPEEDKLLSAKFKGKMPKAEAKLAGESLERKRV